MILFNSCEFVNYYDSHGIEDGRIYCWSEGQKYYPDLSEFNLLSDNLHRIDTITMDDAVKTANDGFTYKCEELLDVYNLGNYEVRKYRFSGAFVVYITSWAHETHYRHLPFEFEAKELWLNNKAVARQPFIFERVDSKVTELPLCEGDEGIDSRYLVEFFINVYDGYSRDTVCSFKYDYEVIRTEESVWDGSGGDITVTVTYDWHPDD